MTTLELGNRRELFVDDVLIENMTNTQLKLHEPISGGKAIERDKPWEGPANGPRSVLPVDGKLYMYYRGMTLAEGDVSGVPCVAISDDNGQTWTKPELGLVDRQGSKANNIIGHKDGTPALRITPWLDTKPGVPADERFKAVFSEPVSGEEHTAFKDPQGPKRGVIFVSEDGFTWRRSDYSFVSELKNSFDGGNTMFWSEAEQQYVLYYRWHEGEFGVGYRSMARITTKDLKTWSEPVVMTYGDTAREQFYTNNTDPYFRAPHLYVAPAARFMWNRRAITEAQADQAGLRMSQGHRYDVDCSDAVLLTSRAGSRQYDRTFMETFIRPGLGYGNWVSRTNYPFTGIFPCGDEQIQMFVARHYMQDSWHAERLLLRTDGFASVSAPHAGGEMVTRPFTFSGMELEINYRTSAPGYIKVEVLNGEAPYNGAATDGETVAAALHAARIPGHALDDCPEIIGDEIKRTVAWKSGTDISALAGTPIRLRFVMKDADLFSVKFE